MPASPPPADPRQQRVLSVLSDRQPRTTAQIAAETGIDRSAMRDLLLRLQRTGHVRQVGTRLEEPTPGSGWQVGKHIRQAVWATADAK